MHELFRLELSKNFLTVKYQLDDHGNNTFPSDFRIVLLLIG